MSEQRDLGLIDFSELRRKDDDFNTLSSKNSSGSYAIDFDNESNEQIMRSFKELREKLKSSSKENQRLRQELSTLQKEVKQIYESQNNLMAINHQLKQRNNHTQQASEEWRKRFAILKEQLTESENMKEQMKVLKQALIQMKTRNQGLQEEKKKIIEISLEEKMNFDQKLSKFDLKKQNDEKYTLQIEKELYKVKETNLKLENQIKKLEIRYDEEIFNKKWSKDNFQKEQYEKTIAEMQSEVTELKNRNRKEKQKRADLEKRILQLEESTGLWNVKAQAFEGEVQVLSKKLKKMERKTSKAKLTANKMTSEKVNWQEKFMKSTQICEQLIGRVKRQLIGDMVQLAKACEFKLNKLKQYKQVDTVDNTRPMTQRTTKSTKHKTDRKPKISVEKENATIVKYNYVDNPLECQKILSERNSNKLKRQQPVKENQGQQQNQQYLQRQIDSLEMKVRKQRQQMQKKLKEKMLYRKIEISNSPKKTKLREDYLKFIFQQ